MKNIGAFYYQINVLISSDYWLIIDINECLDYPCQNGGSCVNMEGDYNCSCLPGWEGKNCSKGELI